MVLSREHDAIAPDDVTIVLRRLNLLPATLKAISPYFTCFAITDMDSPDGTLDVVASIPSDKAAVVHDSAQSLLDEGYAAAAFCASFAKRPWIPMLDATAGDNSRKKIQSEASSLVSHPGCARW